MKSVNPVISKLIITQIKSIIAHSNKSIAISKPQSHTFVLCVPQARDEQRKKYEVTIIAIRRRSVSESWKTEQHFFIWKVDFSSSYSQKSIFIINKTSKIADAICDRVIHNSHRIELKGDSLRKKFSKISDNIFDYMYVI